MGWNGQRLNEHSALWESERLDVGRNAGSRAADWDGDCKFSSCGMGFMSYLHAPHHEGIPTPSSTSSVAASTIAEPPFPATSKHGGNGQRREGGAGIHLMQCRGGR